MPRSKAHVALLILLATMSIPSWAYAAEGGPKADRTLQPEDEDYSNTPFTGYGEFNEESDEEADTKFFQYGRFFGISLGLGFESATGNRGALWQGGVPAFEFKVHYWFDFHFALDLGFYTASHYFQSNANNVGHVDVNMIHVGLDLKYYFDTKDLSSAISFANPYLLLGAGSFTKTETSTSLQTPDTETGMGLSFGGGLEFVLKPRKVYLEIEVKGHYVNFQDTYYTTYQSSNGLADLTGLFFTTTAGILFTW